MRLIQFITNLIVAPCIFAESLQFINQRMHIKFHIKYVLKVFYVKLYVHSVVDKLKSFSLLHFCRQLYMFRVLTPIIRSSYNCNYSFWY